jgi:hypothetical protein
VTVRHVASEAEGTKKELQEADDFYRRSWKEPRRESFGTAL